MLSGGNPTGGANPSGTGSSINYIGNHCYANSGPVTVEDNSSGNTTLIDFTTGNAYIVATLHMFNNQANALDDFVRVLLDGQEIINARYTGSTEFHQDQPTRVLIPPFSRFQIKASCDDSPIKFSAVLVGEVYE